MLVPLPPCMVAYLCVCVWKCICVLRVHGYIHIHEDACWCTGCSHLLLCNLVLWWLSFIIIFFTDLGVDECRGQFPWASPVWVQSGWSWDWSPSRPPLLRAPLLMLAVRQNPRLCVLSSGTVALGSQGRSPGGSDCWACAALPDSLGGCTASCPRRAVHWLPGKVSTYWMGGDFI